MVIDREATPEKESALVSKVDEVLDRAKRVCSSVETVVGNLVGSWQPERPAEATSSQCSVLDSLGAINERLVTIQEAINQL